MSRSRPPAIPAILAGRKVGWVPLGAGLELASSRLRCHLPMQALREAGLQVEIFSETDGDSFDAVVFQKAYENEHLRLADRLRANGVRVMLDVCDNHLLAPATDTALQERASRLREMLRIAHLTTVSTPELARLLGLQECSLVDDYPDYPVPNGARWRRWLKRCLEIRRSPLRLVWFGTAGERRLGAGLVDLERIVPELNEAAKSVRMELDVISNDNAAALDSARAAKFPTRFIEWDRASFARNFPAYDACVIPVTPSAFTSGKTANRPALALASRVPVICDMIPSYEPLRRFVFVADWACSVCRVARSPLAARRRANAGGRWVLHHHTKERVVGQWLDALAALFARGKYGVSPAEIITEELSACPLCGSVRSQYFCPGRDLALASTSQPFAYQRCRECRILFQSPRPTKETARFAYPSANYQPYAGSTTAAPGRAAWLESWKHWLLACQRRCLSSNRQTLLADFYQPERERCSILDFGCGSPNLLDSLKTQGWETCGADFNRDVLAAVSAAGHDVLSPEELGRVENRFDAVRLNHVVEHLYDPRATLARLFAALKPGGRIHLATPNARAWSCRIFGRFWFALECPRHVIVFHPEALRRLLLDAGFSTLEIVFESKPADTRRSLCYLASAFGLVRSSPWQWPQESPLDCLWVPANWLAQKFAASGRFHIFARKPYS